MLVTIIYNTEYSGEAASLKGAILEEWSGCKINKLGINGAINKLAPNMIQKSNFIKIGSTGTGEIKEVTPIIASKLKIFDPIKFPKTTSEALYSSIVG